MARHPAAGQLLPGGEFHFASLIEVDEIVYSVPCCPVGFDAYALLPAGTEGNCRPTRRISCILK